MTSTILDRVVQWNLDLGGDLYGDERERLRWYEGMATAASLQGIVLPWAAAVLVWPLGKASVLPIGVMLLLQYLSQVVATVYVRRRHVDTTPRSWSPKRITLFAVTVVPYVVYVVGSSYLYDPSGDTWKGAATGGAVGVLAGLAAMYWVARRRARQEAAAGDDA